MPDTQPSDYEYSPCATRRRPLSAKREEVMETITRKDLGVWSNLTKESKENVQWGGIVQVIPSRIYKA